MIPKTWAERLEQDTFTEQDISDAKEWPTCAVGELKGIERGLNTGYPLDIKLALLGNQFYLAVSDQSMGRARSIYKRIHEQTTALKQQAAEGVP